MDAYELRNRKFICGTLGHVTCVACQSHDVGQMVLYLVYHISITTLAVPKLVNFERKVQLQAFVSVEFLG